MRHEPLVWRGCSVSWASMRHMGRNIHPEDNEQFMNYREAKDGSHAAGRHQRGRCNERMGGIGQPVIQPITCR